MGTDEDYEEMVMVIGDVFTTHENLLQSFSVNFSIFSHSPLLQPFGSGG